MKHYDVFNGDADGILALLQLRQVEPREAVLITGVKRDIALLSQLPVDQTPKSITVLDISMEKNKVALEHQLETGAQVLYVDHHRTGDIPVSTQLNAHIDLSADTCTALIVDKLLKGQKRLWAITAAFGDNLLAVANGLAKQYGLNQAQTEQLQELGTLINYNGYGESLQDLHFSPEHLYQALLSYPDPFACIEDKTSVYHKLKAAFKQDHQQARSAQVVEQQQRLLVIELADAPWARRISGVYGNELANLHPNKAIIILTRTQDEAYRVSLRAPINNKQGAGDICAQFATGGGRAAAAGINALPSAKLNELISKVIQYYYKADEA